MIARALFLKVLQSSLYFFLLKTLQEQIYFIVNCIFWHPNLKVICLPLIDNWRRFLSDHDKTTKWGNIFWKNGVPSLQKGLLRLQHQGALKLLWLHAWPVFQRYSLIWCFDGSGTERYYIGAKSPIGVQLSWDLVNVKATAYCTFYIISPIAYQSHGIPSL